MPPSATASYFAFRWQTVTMNQKDISVSVVPGLTRNPAVHLWIPAFAGMTWLSIVFFMTAY